jgi:hypothetical protein
MDVAGRMAFIRRPGVLAAHRHFDRSRKQASATGATGWEAVGGNQRVSTMPIPLLWGAKERFNPFDISRKMQAALPHHAEY